MALSEALLDGARVTIIEYVQVVVLSCAVTTVVIVVAVPSAPNVILPDAVAEVTLTPFNLYYCCVSVLCCWRYR